MNRRKAAFRVLYAAVLTAFCVTGAALVCKGAEARRAGAFYETLRETAGRQAPPEHTPQAGGGVSAPPPARCAQVGELAALFPDTAAWLQIPDTPVDYPVMQGADNAYYLDRLPDASRSAAGSLFLDSRCTPDSRNLIIYGHNAGGGAMFGSLRRYREEDYLLAHPVLRLTTETAEYECRIFCVRLADAYGDAYTTAFAGEADFSAYCRRAREEAICAAGEAPAAGSTLVTLSICTGRFRTERLLVQAVLYPADRAGEEGSGA